MPSKNKKIKDDQVHEALKGLNLQINTFGEIQSNLEIERINRFLDEHLEDKKFQQAKDKEYHSEEE